MAKDKKKAKKDKLKFTAKTADKHELYQRSVQAPEHEVAFFSKAYKKQFGQKPMTLREDFCGTGLLCGEWVKSHKGRTATGVDICGDTLAWGKTHNIAPLGDAAERVTLLQEDVRAERPGKFQIINALNFSYWIFDTRNSLREYFAKARAGLEEEGLFICDVYGGWESHQPMTEPRRIAGGFTYVWDQDSFDPITHRVVNHIHFEFKDGTKMEKAFTYEWRFWSILEIKELLEEAGFSKVTVYWDGTEEDDEEDYQPTTKAENQAGWLSYIVAVR